MKRIEAYIATAIALSVGCVSADDATAEGLKFGASVVDEVEAWEAATGQRGGDHRLDLQVQFSVAAEDAPVGTPTAAFLDAARSMLVSNFRW